MEHVHWDVPSLNKKKKVEKYDTPVVTINALDKKGAGRRMLFNKAAIAALDLLGGDSNIAFGFLPNNEIVVSTFPLSNPSTFVLNKNFTIRDKRTFEYIARILELDTNLENELHFNLVDATDDANSNKFLKYVSYTNGETKALQEEPVALEEVDSIPQTPEEAIVMEEKTKSTKDDLDEQW